MTDPGEGAILYSFSLGMVAAVNPCGFPLLPAYLVLSGGHGETPVAHRLVRALVAGLSMTVAFVALFGIIGTIVETGLGALGWVPWVMIPVGAALLAVGVVTASGRRFPLRLPTPGLPSDRRMPVTFAVFGVAYGVASLTCALPVFLIAVADPFSTGGALTGATDGLAYALGMGLVVTAVSVAGVGARQLRLGRVRAAGPAMQRLAGAVLGLVGAYLVLYWVSYVVDPLGLPGPVRVVERIQGAVADTLSASPRASGAVIGAVVVGALIAAGVYGTRGASPSAAAVETVALRPPPTSRHPHVVPSSEGHR